MLRPPNLMLTQTSESSDTDSPAWMMDQWMPWPGAIAPRSQPGSSSTSSSCGVCAASGLCSVPTFNSGSSSNVSPIFDTLALHFLVGHASGTVVAFIVMWTYISDNSGSDNCLGPSLIPVLW